MANWKDNYSNRYYAYGNTDSIINGYPVVGWVDVTLYTDKPDWLPDANAMVALTDEQWNARLFVNQVIKAGQIVTETHDVPAIPLKTQASSALSTARTYVYNNYGILNETTPDNWVTYLKALMAISNGTDTASTVLPNSPITNTGTSTPTASTTTATTSTATTTS